MAQLHLLIQDSSRYASAGVMITITCREASRAGFEPASPFLDTRLTVEHVCQFHHPGTFKTSGFSCPAPMVGVEPTTCRFKVGCSTIELHRNVIFNYFRLLRAKRDSNPPLFVLFNLLNE